MSGLIVSSFDDGEVIGVDADGCVMQWDSMHKSIYNCGESLDEFGIANLTSREKARLSLQIPSMFSSIPVLSVFTNQ